jgi:hypothetical protein
MILGTIEFCWLIYGLVLIFMDNGIGIGTLNEDMKGVVKENNNSLFVIGFPEWWAVVSLIVILVLCAVNCILYFIKIVFYLALYCYFRYWGGLDA